MKTNFILLILTITTSIATAQNKTERNTQKLLGEWTIDYQQEITKENNVTKICKKGFIDSTKVVFNSDYSLTLKLANKKEEQFTWTIKKNKIEIKNVNGKTTYNALNDNFDIFFMENDKVVFLRKKGTYHDGLQLSR